MKADFDNETKFPADLLTPADVRRLLGMKGRTSHTLRAYDRRGLLRPIRLNARTLRFDPRDVARFIDEARSR
jgi:DNA-binding transcriptional MerR regulator